nr:glycosyltransferase [Rhodococcus rhodnii]
MREQMQEQHPTVTENGELSGLTGLQVGSTDRPSGLTVQRTLFAAPSPLVSDDMYASVKGSAARSRAGIQLGPRGSVETNTYFGRFPASYWQRWTTVTEVAFVAEVEGRGDVEIVATDYEGRRRTVATARVDATSGTTQLVRIPARIDRFVDGGALFARLRAGGAGLTVHHAEWTVPFEGRLRPASVVICTFNRADDCVATLTAMADDPIALLDVDTVYVVDQGTDRVDSRAGFQHVRELLGSKLVYLNQPNLGGAGGFTRGLFEVHDVRGQDHANVIFMDDDVLCEPEAVVRMNTFANLTTEPAIVGAQMLYLLHPDRVHVGAEAADLQRLEAGLPVKDALANRNAIKNKQDFRVDAAYNGWWSCLIPSEIVASVGYPLPVFFQWDDIEFGYRSRAQGFATVTLPGAAVWHADFAWKDWDEWHRYFNLRNAMITAALHIDVDSKALAAQLRTDLFRYLVSMQYGMAFTLIKAIEDFLRGPEFLKDGGVEAAAAIRRDRSDYGETIRHPANDVPGLRPADMTIHPAASTPKQSLMWAILAKRALGQWRGRVIGHPVAVPAEDAHWWHVSLFSHVVVTDSSQEGVRVRRRDKALARTLLVRGLRALRRLRREMPDVAGTYRDAMPELTSRENWARLYGR